MRQSRGQTLVSLALLLPLVLLPVLAYAVQVTLLATRSSQLRSAVARAAEDATGAVDIRALRILGTLQLEPMAAGAIARGTLATEYPLAVVDAVTVGTTTVTVSAHENVPAGFGGLLRAAPVTLEATATARISAGYASPSSRLPLPTRSLSMTG